MRRLRAFRGIDTLSALIIVLEVVDFTGFPRAVQLGSWLGLVPSREQSGETDRHGSITKTGSRYARRILVEAAWHYARPPRIGQTLYERQEGLPDHVLQIAARARPPLPGPPTDAERNKPGNVITVACARELACFLWAAANAAITRTDSPSTLGWGGAGPRSPLARAKLLWAALTRPRPILDTRRPATEPGTWGSQPPHMRLTDVENFARRPPPEHTSTNPQRSTEGGINGAHLTTAPP